MSQLARAPLRGVPVVLHDAATTGNGIVMAIPSSFRNHKITIKNSAGVASGAIQPETADAPDYAGTWAPIGGGAITVPAASSTLEYNWQGIYEFFRARISTAIGGGTVTVEYQGS